MAANDALYGVAPKDDGQNGGMRSFGLALDNCVVYGIPSDRWKGLKGHERVVQQGGAPPLRNIGICIFES
jgi:hypothetical protein